MQFKRVYVGKMLEILDRESPTPGPWTGTGPWPVRNRAAQQEVSSGQAERAKLHLYLQLLPITRITA